MESIAYILLAILGLGFLVFIHELGHFWVARKQGMKVEAFSIGFGKPIYTWKRGDVQWMLCILPFGGYVRIAGMQKEGSREPYEIADGFYAKRPWQRIKVALAGPVVNIVFSLVAFTLLWAVGGRPKSFAEFTNRIGWVDPQSTLYHLGVRPGDVIQRYDNRSFHGFKDLLVASLMSDKQVRIEGYKIDDITGKKIGFDYTLDTYESPQITRDPLQTIGILSPASYLIYDGQNGESIGAPVEQAGMQPGDRIVWANGELVFSVQQLSALTNESTAFLTVQRGSQIFQAKVPRAQVKDLTMKPFEKAEIGDWQYEAGIKGKLQDLYFIPYNLSPDCVVESKIGFLDTEQQSRALDQCQRCSYHAELNEGDRILAIDGIEVKWPRQFLAAVQERHVLLIVERAPFGNILWKRADTQFEDLSVTSLASMVRSIGTEQEVPRVGDLYLLHPIVPRVKGDLSFSPEQQERLSREIAATKKEIESIRDPAKRGAALQQLENGQKRLVLGIPLRDREVIYNPNPLQQFQSVIVDTWRTLSGLFSGTLKPKYMSGPVGIVHVVHQSWMVGAKEAIFWMAVISLNLGIVNLLPIPVLDGGHIMFSVLEAIRKRPLRSKTMERLILPFIGLLIAFFVYITYQDIARIFS